MFSEFDFLIFFNWIPSLLLGLLILLIGYVVAKILEGVVSKLLRKVRVNDRLGTVDKKMDIEKIISKVFLRHTTSSIYYVF